MWDTRCFTIHDRHHQPAVHLNWPVYAECWNFLQTHHQWIYAIFKRGNGDVLISNKQTPLRWNVLGVAAKGYGTPAIGLVHYSNIIRSIPVRVKMCKKSWSNGRCITFRICSVFHAITTPYTNRRVNSTTNFVH